MSGEKKELSQLAKTILGGAGHITTFTQTEFDEALVLAKAEIMQVAIETTKHAIMIERDECAKIVRNYELPLTRPMTQTELDELAEKILNRIPTQRQ